MHTHEDNLLFFPLLNASAGDVKSLRQVSATDTCRIHTRLPTQLSFVGFNPRSPHHVGILASLASGVSERILYLVHSVSKCICTGSLTWGAPKCTGSHFRSTDSLQIPTWALLPTTFDYALLQPTSLSSLNSDLLSHFHQWCLSRDSY